MAKDEKNRDRAADHREGFGDDQGTRIGSPTQSTGAGAEAAEGMHSADGDREPDDRTALEGKPTGRGHDREAHRSGSEPIDSHSQERSSGYGGEMGEPKK